MIDKIMKKLLFLIGLLCVITACEQQVMKKPVNLIPEDTMVEILSDIAIYQAVDGYDPLRISSNNLKLDDYIFNKYKVNAKIIEASNKYYASDVEGYKRLYNKVIERLDEQRKAVGAEIEKTTGVPPTDAAN